MSRRSGLGRGLGALIPTDLIAEQPLDGESFLVELPITAVEPNPHQPRENFDEESLAALSDSIRELGLLQPILVRLVGEDRYELIAGERRWRAARRAGLATLPAIVRAVSDTGSLEQALVENLHREDLSPLEEAAAYQQLIEDFDLTQEAVATRVGKSRSAVANTLRLFQLPPTVQRLMNERRLTAGHARALLGTADRPYQEALAQRVVAEGLTVRQTEDAVRRRTELEAKLGDASPAKTATPAVPPAGLLELEQLLSDCLDTSVHVRLGRGRGRITIDFATVEDLERIYRLIAEGPVHAP